MTSGRVVVVGSVNVDHVSEVERLPRPGETVRALASRSEPGGKGANQAVAAARAGAGVTMVGAVGEDADGRLCRSALAEEGVGTSGLHTVPAPTGVALVGVQSDGENAITVVGGANDELSPPHVVPVCAGLQAGDVVLVQLEIPVPTVAAAVRAAAAAGATVVLNAAPAVEGIADLLAEVDVLVVNEHEARVLGGSVQRTAEPGVEAAVGAGAVLADRHHLEVVVTLGGDGAAVLGARGGSRRVAAPSVQVVDTTGAGDAFTGYLAAQLAAGADLMTAVTVAVRAGAAAVTAPGARASTPRPTELQTS